MKHNKPMFDAIVGDKVWDVQRGWGNIIEIDPTSYYPIVVRFVYENHDEVDTYMFDGRSKEIHKNPTLFWDEIKITPPPRPKRKVKKSIEGWANVYKHGRWWYFYEDKERADWADSCGERVACVKLTGEYDVEE